MWRNPSSPRVKHTSEKKVPHVSQGDDSQAVKSLLDQGPDAEHEWEFVCNMVDCTVI